ncbi:coumaroyl-CoA:anthocyanidin 3-O-glucoside-6''-O-coumaroyltransferase 1-like [Corylus avellana]|uniref:coumaroyl-CoA:anthocyanidin 3-O-glucoside-6''-O-coumaroyltransferase 1-like n=1 Tax=Corylus avellana TaxID=13451 RepID=UPI001E209BF7|nr:coumaroyl-CoA:anthocyanidin 3-O-glucoside-6''-O-coumaroyltransferase 1-like [Corylus avellana]
MAEPYRVTVIEESQVAPPPNSVPTTSLPLTFFDIQWLPLGPIQSLFFYQVPQPTNYFTQAILPTLKHSLSLTLQLFFPLAANLVCPPQTDKPHILYTEGNSVPFTVAEAAGDFNHLIVNNPRDARELHHFVAHLPPTHVSSDDTRLIPLMATQVTVFPNEGICIGMTFRHAAADGRAIHHFMKSWASICRTGGDLTCLDKSPPFHDRAVIKDPNGLDNNYLKEMGNWASALDEDSDLINKIAEKVRATFVMGRAHIEGLKQWVKGQCTNKEDLEPLHLSTFVVTCALIWVCLIKSQHKGVCNFSDDNSKLCYFIFAADCRNRLKFPIPCTYFGNCVAPCFVGLERREVVGETGIFEAVKAIGNKVGQLETEALRGAETWASVWKEMSEMGSTIVSVAGSPRLGVYDTDFGWGRPKKSEVVHIDVTGAFSLAECRDEDGGIEVGLALSRKSIGDFNAIWEQSLKLF